MTSLPFLDVAIAVVFILTFLCLISTGVQELISHVLDQRFQMLQAGVASLLHAAPENAAVKEIFSHPLVTALVRNTHADGTARPSYLPSDIFAQTVISNLQEKAAKAGQAQDTVAGLIAAVDNTAFKKTLTSLTSQGLGTVQELEKKLADHFDATMDRASGWYKRKAQSMLLIIGIVVAIVFNADLPAIAQTLYRDPALRSQLIVAAEKQQTPPTLEQINRQTEGINLPLGWHKATAESSGDAVPWTTWASRAIGWGLTGAAISLGAPFWFDLLSRFVNMRSSKNVRPSKGTSP